MVVYPESDAFARKQSGEDMRVQAEVEQKIRGWKRYIFTSRIADADIVIAVRKGAYAKPRVVVETSTSHPPQLSVGTDAGPNKDMLVVWNAFLSGQTDVAGLTSGLQQITDKVANDASIQKEKVTS